MESTVLSKIRSYRYAMELCRVSEKQRARKPLVMFVIYENPADFPDKFVARLFDCGRPTQYCTVRDTLAEARESIPKGLTRINRAPFDHKEIVETWI